MFPDLKRDRKQPVPNAGSKSGPGRGFSRTLGREKSGSREMAFGNADLYYTAHHRVNSQDTGRGVKIQKNCLTLDVAACLKHNYKI